MTQNTSIAYSDTRDTIEKGKLISDSDLSFIDENIGLIQENWEKRQVFRTETEMRVSVLNDIKFPTSASKYWQCIREQAVFYQQLVQLSFDYRRNAIDQTKKKLKIEKSQNELKKELLQIDLEELQFAQMNMKQVAGDRMREIRLWQQQMNELDNGTFDTKDVNAHQLESYLLRWQCQAENMGTASPSETANLMGQLQTAEKHVKKLKVGERVKLVKKKPSYIQERKYAIHKSN